MLRLIAFLAFLLSSAAALGQPTPNAVRQSGNASPGHAACFVISGVIQDATNGGDPCIRLFGETMSGPGVPFYINSAPIAGPFNQFGIGIGPISTGSAFIISDTAYGGATPIPLAICVNGFCGLIVSQNHLTASEFQITGLMPVVTAGAGDCGTGPALALASNDNVGRITVGSSANGGQCTLTFATAFSHAPVCYTQDETSNSRLTYALASTTGVVIKAASTFTAADSLVYSCVGYY